MGKNWLYFKSYHEIVAKDVWLLCQEGLWLEITRRLQKLKLVDQFEMAQFCNTGDRWYQNLVIYLRCQHWELFPILALRSNLWVLWGRDEERIQCRLSELRQQVIIYIKMLLAPQNISKKVWLWKKNLRFCGGSGTLRSFTCKKKDKAT